LSNDLGSGARLDQNCSMKWSRSSSVARWRKVQRSSGEMMKATSSVNQDLAIFGRRAIAAFSRSLLIALSRASKHGEAPFAVLIFSCFLGSVVRSSCATIEAVKKSVDRRRVRRQVRSGSIIFRALSTEDSVFSHRVVHFFSLDCWFTAFLSSWSPTNFG
jgi:hypothetical protein